MTEKIETPKEILVPLEDLKAVDVSDRNVERMARGFIMGTQSIARRRDIRAKLEEKVTHRIGKKGKYLVDKLFELIEGVYIVDKKKGVRGQAVEVRYYQVPPNLTAIVYALDRVLGKPKQVSEHSEEKKGIILVEHVIKNMAANPYNKKNEDGTGEDIVGRGRILPAGRREGVPAL